MLVYLIIAAIFVIDCLIACYLYRKVKEADRKQEIDEIREDMLKYRHR